MRKLFSVLLALTMSACASGPRPQFDSGVLSFAAQYVDVRVENACAPLLQVLDDQRRILAQVRLGDVHDVRYIRDIFGPMEKALTVRAMRTDVAGQPLGLQTAMVQFYQGVGARAATWRVDYVEGLPPYSGNVCRA